MTIGLEARPSRKNPVTAKYRGMLGLRAYQPYPASPNRKKKVHNRFLRSAIHATDSTFSGWIANSAATRKLRHVAPVKRSNNIHSTTAFATCKSRLVT